MTESTTVVVQRCLARLQTGDEAARKDLINHACKRLQRLTRKVMGDFRQVRRWEDSCDVLQEATIRLMRALHDVTPESPRQFFALAALQIRRQLLDLARRYRGPEGHAVNEVPLPVEPDGDAIDFPAPADTNQHPLGDWTAFHEHIETLPVEEREVVGLLWYHGLTQAEAAEILNVNERTVKRYWQSARLRLHAALEKSPSRGE